jgi:hypothetical protein
MGTTRQRPRQQRSGECVYCGAIGPITDDHVPPRSFFPAKAPKNLITVPSCAACNQGFAADDDYARLLLTTTEGAIGNPARDELKAKVERFAVRRESARSLESFYATLRTAYLPSETGILLRRQGFVIDRKRLDAFAVRVTKALFYREKGYRLPDHYAVNAIHHSLVAELIQHLGESADFMRLMISELNHSLLRSWGDAFAYAWVPSPNGAERTWWMLHFYGNPLFLCWTKPKGQEAPHTEQISAP